MSESLGEEGPHDSVTCEQQASTEQPQGEVELQTHTADVRKQQLHRQLNWSSVILFHCLAMHIMYELNIAKTMKNVEY